MDIVAIIGELRKELERIDAMILALDSLQHGKRRGRPPKLLQQLRERQGSPDSDHRSRKKTRRKSARKEKPS